ncbi:MAG: glycosyltransferase family 2 protein [Microbacterium sp.]
MPEPTTDRTPEVDPELSVIIPTHNVRPWISETLSSVLAQDVDGMEVILVDDHSTDGTVELVEKIIGDDPRATLVRAVTHGGGSARNEGVRRARGRYIAFADGDDIVPADAYRAMLESAHRTGSQVVVGDYMKFAPASIWHPTASMEAFATAVERVTLTDIPTLIFSRPCWNKAFDRQFWLDQRISFPDVARSNDIVPMVTAYVNARSIDVIEDVVYLYRDRPGGTSMSAKTSSSAAFVSYLTQEMICAGLVEGVKDNQLSARYASLIYDRDGFFHARKFLSAWQQSGDEDTEIATLVDSLLSKCGLAPRWIDPRKRMTMTLLREGEFLAARAAAQTVDGGEWQEIEGATRLRGWSELLRAMQAKPDLLAGLEQSVASHVLSALGSVRLSTHEAEEQWLELSERAVSALGDLARVRIPGMGSRESVRRRRAFDGKVSAIFGGDSLRMHGWGSSTDGTPVLWSIGGILNPTHLTWRETDEGMVWDAQFSVSRLPRGVEVQPAFAFSDGTVVGARCEAEIPEYRRMENVLYEQDAQWVRIERRRHWLVRAPRRALIIAVRALRSLRG